MSAFDRFLNSLDDSYQLFYILIKAYESAPEEQSAIHEKFLAKYVAKAPAKARSSQPINDPFEATLGAWNPDSSEDSE